MSALYAMSDGFGMHEEVETVVALGRCPSDKYSVEYIKPRKRDEPLRLLTRLLSCR